MYKIFDQEFITFEAVRAHAWNTLKIDLIYEPLTEEAKQEACRELEWYIKEIDKREEQCETTYQ